MFIEFKRVETGEQLKACLALRHDVFVEEQKVPVDLEIDEHDYADAIHFMGKSSGEVVATGRICVFGDIAKIQRVAVARTVRGSGAGRGIMKALINHIRENELAPKIALDAQTYAIRFYEAFGFRVEGAEFDDAGIPHVHMRMDV